MEVGAVLGKDRDKTKEQLREAIAALRRQISELKQAEAGGARTQAALQASEERFRTLIEAAQDAIFLKDRNLKFTAVNPAFVKHVGIPAAKLLGNTGRAFMSRAEAQRIREEELRVLTGEAVERETASVVKGRSAIKHLIKVPVRDSAGKIVGLCSIGRDITERKRTEEVLRQERESFYSILQKAPYGVMVRDHDEKTLYVNTEFTAITGYTLADIPTTKEWGRLAYPKKKYRDIAQRETDRLFRKKLNRVFARSFSIVTKDGAVKEIEFRPTMLDDGRTLMMLADITERKRAEEELRESAERLRTLIETTKAGVSAIDDKGVATYANKQLRAMWGRSPDEIIGHSVFEFLDAENRKVLKRLLAKRKKGARDVSPYELAWVRKDGGKVHTIVFPTPFFDMRGHHQSSFVIVTDITERKQTAEALTRNQAITQRLAEEGAVIAEIGRIISSTLKIEEVYERFAAEAKKLIPFDRLSVTIQKPPTNEVRVTYVYGLDMPDFRAGTVLLLQGSVDEALRQTRAGLIIPMATLSDEGTKRYSRLIDNYKMGLRSAMCVPLISGAEVIGGLHFKSKAPDIYTEQELRLAERIGRQIAGAIANALLYGELKQTEEVLTRNQAIAQRLADEAAVIAEIGRIIGSTLNIEEVYERFAAEAKKLIPFDRLTVTIQKPQEHKVHVAYVFGLDLPDRRPGASFLLQGSVSEAVRQTRAGLIIPMATLSDEGTKRYSRLIDNYRMGLRSALSVPLISGAEVIGALHFRSKTPDIYTEQELRLAERIGAQIAGAVANAQLYADLKQTEASLRDNEEKYRSLVQFTEDPVYLVNRDQQYLFMNEKYLSRLGVPQGHVLGRHYGEFHSREEQREFSEHVEHVFKTGRFVQYEHRSRRDGRYFLRTLSPVRDVDNRIEAITVISKDITERKRAEKELSYMATHDSLTGLPNRMLFNDRLTLALAQAHRHNKKLSLMLLDLDYFKNVNDGFGHNVGDQLLRAVGNRLLRLLRRGDTVARVGGDEFLLLLPEIAHADDAITIARKILEAFRKPCAFDDHELVITISIGISIYPDDSDNADTLLKHADIAMYRAKDKGRETYHRYTPS
jgi:diguanylate cyclase (GGDEF)-like protein/PAS domain S-box-containing protein